MITVVFKTLNLCMHLSVFEEFCEFTKKLHASKNENGSIELAQNLQAFKS